MNDSLFGIFFGIFVGFGFGVGCTLAVMYSIYMGGYRKALEESLLDVKTKRFEDALGKARERVARKLQQD